MSPELRAKLHPARFSGISGKMVVILCCLFRNPWEDVQVSPQIVGLTTTSDGFLLAMQAGEIGANHFLGTVAELRCNWERLLDSADLTPQDRREAESAYAAWVPR